MVMSPEFGMMSRLLDGKRFVFYHPGVRIVPDHQVVHLQIVDGVHANGSFIYLQLWSLGRAADPAQLKSEDSSFAYVSSSPATLTGRDVAPRAMTVPEIKEHVQLYATAASNAVFKAGFDGVEIHGANGYLVDQFIQDVTNQRTDQYGGSVENRSRFILEIVDAVVNAVGASRTAIRFSPWSSFQGLLSIHQEHAFAA